MSNITLKKAFPANISWSWTRLEDACKTCLDHVFMFWTRLQRNNFTSSKRSWRHLEDVLEDEKVLRWRRLEDVLKACLEDVLKTCLEDVLKTLWRQTKYLPVISVSNKSKYGSNKSIFHKSIYDNSKTSPKCII